MKIYPNCRIFVFMTIFLLFGTCFIPLSMTQTVIQNYKQYTNIDDGLILFSPMQSTTTYLIDKNGAVNHTWPSSEYPGESVYMLEDGSILRTIKLSLSGGGAGGGVQKITWDGSLIWDFEYYTNDYLSHHDIEPLSNGNILLIAWEYKTRDEAIAAGRDPNKLQGDTLKPDHIIEVEPTGPTSGDIVWEWHVWDHLIQDYDSSKDNYGVVADHPELIDINYGSRRADWLHINSIDYHEEFDQIMVSVRHFNEIWVIDHSTTTDEAAGHTGGNSGKGGDLLYRWGNPQAYRAGTTGDQKLFRQHDARWIDSDCPGSGNILVFNNGRGRPGTDYTSVDEIVPPVDSNGNYYLEPGSPYEPGEQIWIYDSDFYAYYLSGSQRLPSGNTLICNGPAGEFLEVTHEKVIVWEYENPYPSPSRNKVFKLEYYILEENPPEVPDLDCEGSFNWEDVEPGETLNGVFQVQNIGGSNSSLNWKIESFPSWGEWSFDPESGENLTPQGDPVTVEVSVVAPNEQNEEFEGYIRVENQDDPEDYDVIPVYLKTPRKRVINTPFFNLLNYVRKYLIFNIWDKA